MADIDLINKLATLKEIDYTALDYSTAQRELIEYITLSQTSEGVNDQFLNGDTAKLFIDLFSYTIEILGFRADNLSNENYLPTANDKQSIIYLLEQVGQRPKNPTASQVTLLAVPNTVSNSDVSLPLRYSFTAVGLDGNPANFEIMNDSTDYFTPVDIPAGVNNFNVKAFSGSYRSLDTISTGEAGFTIELPEFPVIEDSIEVSVTPVSSVNLTPEIILSTRATKVDSLIENVDDIIYKPTFDADNKATLTFSTNLFGVIPPNGHTIHVDYRVGGGSRTNVTEGSINFSAAFQNAGGENISFIFSNPTNQASGGDDADDVDTLKLISPGLVRANDNLVSDDDYEAIIGDVGSVQDVFALDRYTDQTSFGGSFGVPENGVFIWVLPETGGEVSPDLRQIIATTIGGQRRLTAIDNFIFNPVYINWDLNANIKLVSTVNVSDTDANGLTIRQRIQQALLDKFGREQAKFKTSVSYSQIIKVIQDFPEVADVVLNTPIQTLTSRENEALRLLETNISLTLTK